MPVGQGLPERVVWGSLEDQGLVFAIIHDTMNPQAHPHWLPWEGPTDGDSVLMLGVWKEAPGEG